MSRHSILAAICAVALAAPAGAQSIPVSNPESEFLKPNVSIYARSGRDFSGVIWERSVPAGGGARRAAAAAAADPPSDGDPPQGGRSPAQAVARVAQAAAVAEKLKPEFRQMYEWARSGSGRFSQSVTNEPLTPDSACSPFILAGDTFYSPTFLIGNDVVLVIQGQNQSNRVIYMNQTMPKSLEPRWSGYSVGRWEGDTLVVETMGFNELTTIVSTGLYHTKQLKITERYTLLEGGESLKAEFRYEDPGSMTGPYEYARNFIPAINQEIYSEERICQEGSNRPVFRSEHSNEPLG